MIACRPVLAVALAAAAALAPLGAAQAAKLPTIDVWNGKTHKKGNGITIYNVRGKKAVQISTSVTCMTTAGEKQQVSLSADGKLVKGKVSVTNKKANGTTGTLIVKAKLPRTSAATGTISWDVPASDAFAACKGSDTLKLKHVISHGG